MKLLYFYYSILFFLNSTNCKKDIHYYTDAEIDEIYEQWVKNDNEELPLDERVTYKQAFPRNLDLDLLREKANSPDELLKLTKKGQSVMMFVSVKNPDSALTTKSFTERMSSLWQTNFYNNHIEAQNFIVEDNRILYLFKEGSQAWDARDFLLKQRECLEILLEGKTMRGPAAEENIVKQEF